MTGRTCTWTRSAPTTTADGRGYETFGNGTAETLRPEQPGDDATR